MKSYPLHQAKNASNWNSLAVCDVCDVFLVCFVWLIWRIPVLDVFRFGIKITTCIQRFNSQFFPIIPHQRKLVGSSAQISFCVHRSGLQTQVPDGSARFRCVPEAGSGGFRRVSEGAGGFQKVPECWWRCRPRVLEGFASLWTKQCPHVQIWNWEGQCTWHCYVCAPAVGDTTEAYFLMSEKSNNGQRDSRMVEWTSVSNVNP